MASASLRRLSAATWTANPGAGRSGVLAAAVRTGDTSAFVTYQAEGGALTRQAAKALPVPDLSDFAVTADGLHLAVSSRAYPRDDRYRTSDLADCLHHALPAIGKHGTSHLLNRAIDDGWMLRELMT